MASILAEATGVMNLLFIIKKSSRWAPEAGEVNLVRFRRQRCANLVRRAVIATAQWHGRHEWLIHDAVEILHIFFHLVDACTVARLAVGAAARDVVGDRSAKTGEAADGVASRGVKRSRWLVESRCGIVAAVDLATGLVGVILLVALHSVMLFLPIIALFLDLLDVVVLLLVGPLCVVQLLVKVVDLVEIVVLLFVVLLLHLLDLLGQFGHLGRLACAERPLRLPVLRLALRGWLIGGGLAARLGSRWDNIAPSRRAARCRRAGAAAARCGRRRGNGAGGGCCA